MKFTWTIDSFSHLTDRLNSLREFRRLGLYERGKRPQFGHEGSHFLDASKLDFESYHLSVKSGSELVGYARISPCTSKYSVCRDIFGYENLRTRAASVGLDLANVFEVSRWTVSPQFIGSKLSLDIVISAHEFVRRSLKGKALVAAVG